MPRHLNVCAEAFGLLAMSAGLGASVWADLRTADDALGSGSTKVATLRPGLRPEGVAPPGQSRSKGTIQLRPEDTAGIPDDELLDLVRAALQA